MGKPAKREPIQPRVYKPEIEDGHHPAKVENWRLRQHLYHDCPELKQNTLAVALAILEHRNQENGKCCPGKETVMKLARASARQFQRAINALKEAKVMYRMADTGHKGVTSRYWFAWDVKQLKEVMAENGVTSNDWFW